MIRALSKRLDIDSTIVFGAARLMVTTLSSLAMLVAVAHSLSREAQGYGCPVLATPMALEDVPIEGYPLARPLDEWAALVRAPGDHARLWRDAADIGHAFVAEALTPAGYAISWRRMITPT